MNTYIFAASHADIDSVGAFEAALNIIINFRGALTKIRPFLWVLEETMLIGALSGPDYTC